MTPVAVKRSYCWLGKLFIALVFFLLPGIVAGQEYKYVNTDNLLVRDRPEAKYCVLAVLHAPCEVTIVPYDDLTYKGNKTLEKRFYKVRNTIPADDGKMETRIEGWVEKRYLIESREKVTVPGSDTVIVMASLKAGGHYSFWKASSNFNYRLFPYPKYKGGERYFSSVAAKKITYHPGPRGGCYYLDAKGRKHYVNAKHCK